MTRGKSRQDFARFASIVTIIHVIAHLFSTLKISLLPPAYKVVRGN